MSNKNQQPPADDDKGSLLYQQLRKLIRIVVSIRPCRYINNLFFLKIG
jgi:hypothetical protein